MTGFRELLSSLLPRKAWFRIAFLYERERPSDDDFWAMLGRGPANSEWPFRELAAWPGVSIHPFDDMFRTILVGYDPRDAGLDHGDEIELWITEVLADGDRSRVGAISGPRDGFVLSFEAPNDLTGKTPTPAARAAFERLVRTLAPVHERFGARLVAMGEPVSSIDGALEAVAAAIEGR